MYKVFIGTPSTKSIHGPMGKTSFSEYLGNLHTDRRQTLWEGRGRQSLSFGMLVIIFRFRFRSTGISKVCMYLHALKLQKIITPEIIEIATSGFHRSTHLGVRRHIGQFRNHPNHQDLIGRRFVRDICGWGRGNRLVP
jgi:hypothetical protein